MSGSPSCTSARTLETTTWTTIRNPYSRSLARGSSCCSAFAPGSTDGSTGRSEDFTGTGDPGDPFEIFTTVEKWAFRFGAEWDPTRWGDKQIAPFAAADFEITEFTERIASYVVAGAAFRIKTVRLLLNAEFHDGPSPMGQFRTIDERWIGASLTVEL